MPTVKFWGSSDDLVEVEGCTSARDFTVTSEKHENVAGLHHNAEFSTPGNATFIVNGHILVKADYNTTGIWTFTAYPPQDDAPYPDWPTTIKQSTQCAHSMELTIEIPDKTALVHRVK